MSEFTLDPRLQSDCVLIGNLELCTLLLMNDSRWPWFILVPRIENSVEIHDLPDRLQVKLQQETSKCAAILSHVCACTKINSGALGNIVRQLHVHIIARNEGDDNWPLPVWGYESRRPYSVVERDQLVKKFSDKLRNELQE